MFLNNTRINWLTLMVLLTGFWTGCSSHRGLIKNSSITFIQAGVTTKTEVSDNLGAPTRVIESQRVYVYEWEDWDRHYGYRHSNYREYRPGPKPERNVNHHIWSFCVAFDEGGRVTRREFLDAPDSESLDQEITQWLKSPKK